MTINYQILPAKRNGMHSVRIVVIAGRKNGYIPTPFQVAHKDVRAGKIRDYRVLDRLDALLREYRAIANEHCTLNMSPQEIIAVIQREKELSKPWQLDFVQYTIMCAAELSSRGQVGTARNRMTAINSLCAFLNTKMINVSDLKIKTLTAWLNSLDGVRAPSLYKSQLQAVYNQAMREFNDKDAGVVRLPFNPFSEIALPRQSPPQKRALTAEQVRAIALLPDKGGRYTLARDMFILSFCLIGMNAVDLLTCPSINNGRVEYERCKTRSRRSDKAFISVLVQPWAQPLVDKYSDTQRAFNLWRRYSSGGVLNRALNKGLKLVGEDIGVSGLTFYAARHSWATIAVNDVVIDKWTVHLALNHVDPATAITDVYIRKDWRVIDDANEKVLRSVFGDI